MEQAAGTGVGVPEPERRRPGFWWWLYFGWVHRERRSVHGWWPVCCAHTQQRARSGGVEFWLAVRAAEHGQSARVAAELGAECPVSAELPVRGAECAVHGAGL